MAHIECTCVEGSDSKVTVFTGLKDQRIQYEADLENMIQVGPLFYSRQPGSPFYVPPQKRDLIRRYIRFLTPANIQKYLVEFVHRHNPCSLRRVYYLCTNFCHKYPDLTTYQIWRRDMMTGESVKMTIVLWEEYNRHLKVEPRLINDCFQRRKRRSNQMQQMHSLQDIVLCQVGPREFVATAAVQIVFLQMIDSIQLLDHIVPWLPSLIEDHQKTTKQRNAEAEQCKAENRPCRRRALNPIKLIRGAPLQSFSSSSS